MASRNDHYTLFIVPETVAYFEIQELGAADEIIWHNFTVAHFDP